MSVSWTKVCMHAWSPSEIRNFTPKRIIKVFPEDSRISERIIDPLQNGTRSFKTLKFVLTDAFLASFCSELSDLRIFSLDPKVSLLSEKNLTQNYLMGALLCIVPKYPIPPCELMTALGFSWRHLWQSISKTCNQQED